MMTNVYVSIIPFLREVSYQTVSQTTYEGEISETLSTASTIQLACFPITFKDLKVLPEGMYDLQDYKFYSVASTLLELNSIVTLSSMQFKITSLSDRIFDGGFSIYYGKSIR
jgi:hypothetical protein